MPGSAFTDLTINSACDDLFPGVEDVDAQATAQLRAALDAFEEGVFEYHNRPATAPEDGAKPKRKTRREQLYASRIPEDRQCFRPVEQQCAEWAAFKPHLWLRGRALQRAQSSPGAAEASAAVASPQPQPSLGHSPAAAQAPGQGASPLPTWAEAPAASGSGEGAELTVIGKALRLAPLPLGSEREEEVLASDGCFEETFAVQHDAWEAHVPPHLRTRRGRPRDEKAMEIGLPPLEPRAAVLWEAAEALLPEVWARLAPSLAPVLTRLAEQRRLRPTSVAPAAMRGRSAGASRAGGGFGGFGRDVEIITFSSDGEEEALGGDALLGGSTGFAAFGGMGMGMGMGGGGGGGGGWPFGGLGSDGEDEEGIDIVGSGAEAGPGAGPGLYDDDEPFGPAGMGFGIGLGPAGAMGMGLGGGAGAPWERGSYDSADGDDEEGDESDEDRFRAGGGGAAMAPPEEARAAMRTPPPGPPPVLPRDLRPAPPSAAGSGAAPLPLGPLLVPSRNSQSGCGSGAPSPAGAHPPLPHAHSAHGLSPAHPYAPPSTSSPGATALPQLQLASVAYAGSSAGSPHGSLRDLHPHPHAHASAHALGRQASPALAAGPGAAAAGGLGLLALVPSRSGSGPSGLGPSPPGTSASAAAGGGAPGSLALPPAGTRRQSSLDPLQAPGLAAAAVAVVASGVGPALTFLEVSGQLMGPPGSGGTRGAGGGGGGGRAGPAAGGRGGGSGGGAGPLAGPRGPASAAVSALAALAHHSRFLGGGGGASGGSGSGGSPGSGGGGGGAGGMVLPRKSSNSVTGHASLQLGPRPQPQPGPAAVGPDRRRKGPAAPPGPVLLGRSGSGLGGSAAAASASAVVPPLAAAGRAGAMAAAGQRKGGGDGKPLGVAPGLASGRTHSSGGPITGPAPYSAAAAAQGSLQGLQSVQSPRQPSHSRQSPSRQGPPGQGPGQPPQSRQSPSRQQHSTHLGAAPHAPATHHHQPRLPALPLSPSAVRAAAAGPGGSAAGGGGGGG
ncbi:hypothetical protein HYH03_016570 [Edaphochlamys debaryana]|uniref:Uncharacterized protein n=1 Tax=Edaphochlamys debaryana TaxID=47281 RepID=A0A836BPR7_9CHLO|nr:hypothetical protein HYH03_016570 [Edaphochlamys debaryana]|eukprot:KAG2484616.1 hypothetical protein HYH03_016570 [Edaphochlamys debaryana]